MNAQLVESEDFDPQQYTEEPAEWLLKKLKPVHMQVCGLLAQGFKNVEVASMTGVTKEYITMLLRQPLIKQELARRADILGARLELLTEKSVDVISEAMQAGNHTEKLKAARLQLEVTHRLGRNDGLVRNDVPDDRLEKLATRLELLLDKKNGIIYDETGKPLAEDAEIIRERIDD